jgi:hypothetical protein
MENKTKVKVLSGLAALALAASYVANAPKKDNRVPEITVKDVVTSIYGKEIEVDNQFVNAYIETLSNAAKENGVIMSREYEPNSLVLNNNEMFELTEWIPTLEEVKANLDNVKPASEETETDVENGKPLVLTINQ